MSAIIQESNLSISHKTMANAALEELFFVGAVYVIGTPTIVARFEILRVMTVSNQN